MLYENSGKSYINLINKDILALIKFMYIRYRVIELCSIFED